MGIIIEAPKEYSGKKPSLFLGGGISHCGDWQHDVARSFSDLNIVIFNPRRKAFDIKKKTESTKQIHWEHRYLRKADKILFWFPKETLCPITLYELGSWSMTKKPLFVGVDPKFARKLDVEVQTKLARPDIKIVYSLKDLVKQVRKGYL